MIGWEMSQRWWRGAHWIGFDSEAKLNHKPLNQRVTNRFKGLWFSSNSKLIISFWFKVLWFSLDSEGCDSRPFQRIPLFWFTDKELRICSGSEDYDWIPFRRALVGFRFQKVLVGFRFRGSWSDSVSEGSDRISFHKVLVGFRFGGFCSDSILQGSDRILFPEGSGQIQGLKFNSVSEGYDSSPVQEIMIRLDSGISIQGVSIRLLRLLNTESELNQIIMELWFQFNSGGFLFDSDSEGYNSNRFQFRGSIRHWIDFESG